MRGAHGGGGRPIGGQRDFVSQVATGQVTAGGLCVGTGRGIECLWPCPRDADTADDEPGQSGQTQSKTQTQRFVLACMGGPAVAPRPRRTDCMFPPGGAAPAVCGWRPPPRDSSSYTQNAAPAVGVHRPYIKRSCNERRGKLNTYYWRYPRSHLTVDVRYFARTAARLRYAVRSSARLGLARPRARRARPPRDSRDPTAPVFDSCAGSAGNNV